MRFTALALLGLTGCMTQVPPDGYGVRAIQFSDVVVPAGMKLREANEESFTLEVGSWRTGHLVYAGTAMVSVVGTQVLERMPRHAWRLMEDQVLNSQTRQLRFERGQYIAQYTIKRQETLTMMIVDYSTQAPGL